MDTVILRKLSFKSIINFGKYTGLSVQQIINLEKKAYLRWVYYNINGISFMPDVLNSIHIFENDEIEKPGINPEKNKEIEERIHRYIDAKYSPLKRVKQRSHNKKRLKSQIITNQKSRKKKYFKKSILQAKNQGK